MDELFDQEPEHSYALDLAIAADLLFGDDPAQDRIRLLSALLNGRAAPVIISTSLEAASALFSHATLSQAMASETAAVDYLITVELVRMWGSLRPSTIEIFRQLSLMAIDPDHDPYSPSDLFAVLPGTPPADILVVLTQLVLGLAVTISAFDGLTNPGDSLRRLAAVDATLDHWEL